MDSTRLPKHALNYQPRGRRGRGRPKKRWQCVDAGTGQMTQSMEEDNDDE
jgi:predicted ArsR family transcriptional regulator